MLEVFCFMKVLKWSLVPPILRGSPANSKDKASQKCEAFLI